LLQALHLVRFGAAFDMQHFFFQMDSWRFDCFFYA